MTEHDQLAQVFEAQRPYLLRVAYAILGSLSEAEDCVQEAWLRLARQPDVSAIRDLRAWCSTTVSRLALDALQSARVRREQYVGPWLPEPLLGTLDLAGGDGSRAAAEDPADRVTLDESVSLALLIVLERLSPAERTAFLLHDVFGFTFEQTGEVTGRTAAAARKLADRARDHVDAGQPRFPPTREQQLEVVGAFVTACTEGDLEGLVVLLDPEVIWRTDGGGVVRAAQQVHQGAEKVARAMLALRRTGAASGQLVEVNGVPGILTTDHDGTLSVISLTVDDGRIVAIDIIRNPEKLTNLPPGVAS